MEKTIDVTTARRQFGTLLDEVFYKGDIITIERKGKPLAQIVPFKDTSSQDAHLSAEQKALLEKLHSLPAISTDKDPTAILRKIRKQKRSGSRANYGK
jgi:prevent-host-death family protein